jgi:hypothetical protein
MYIYIHKYICIYEYLYTYIYISIYIGDLEKALPAMEKLYILEIELASKCSLGDEDLKF